MRLVPGGTEWPCLGSFDGRIAGAFGVWIAMTDWSEQASEWGLESGYFDIQGRRCDAEPETLQRIVESLVAAGHSPRIGNGQSPERQPAYKGSERRTWVLAVQLY